MPRNGPKRLIAGSKFRLGPKTAQQQPQTGRLALDKALRNIDKSAPQEISQVNSENR